MTATLRHPIAPMAELVRDMSPHAQALAIPAIQRALNQAHHYDERMDEARSLEREFKALVHVKPAPCIETLDCPRCQLEGEYIRVFGSAERARACLEGRGS